jgi:hypothetical protein
VLPSRPAVARRGALFIGRSLLFIPRKADESADRVAFIAFALFVVLYELSKRHE